MIETIKTLLEVFVSTFAIAAIFLLGTAFLGILVAICAVIWVCAIPIASFVLALDMQSGDRKEKK